MSTRSPMWQPDPARRDSSAMARLYHAVLESGAALPPIESPGAYQALHRWSVENLESFWAGIWSDATGAGTASGPTPVLQGNGLAPPGSGGAEWFPEARLNFATCLLGRRDQGVAMVAWDERGPVREITWAELRSETASLATALREMGVGRGDRVAGWLPNVPAAVIAMLATASLGAIWTSCSPDFGVDGIVDRFGQTEPAVLVFADGYRYGGKNHDCTDRLGAVLQRIPSIRHAIRVRHFGPQAPLNDPRVVEWDALVGDPHQELPDEAYPFDQPLYILYSSGTTGLPKCLVHGAGGTLLQHVKELCHHVDLRPDERIFYFTTCGWMMWNWLVSGLAVGATIVLYDGSPMPPDEPDILWRLADEARVDVFGTSAKYLALAEKAGVQPRQGRQLAHLRAVLSTGSPLAPESFDWVASSVGPVQVASISGGTDIVSCFVLGNPLSPVWRGEIQGAGLGMAVEVFDPDGRPVAVGTPGELVCTRPFPAMPVAFWNDADDRRYRDAYFDRWPGVWHHGDWVSRTEHGGFVISGRSDATLNPGGVRIGTAEIYRQVESIDEVVESIAVGRRRDGDVEVMLFVRLRNDLVLDDTLRSRIRAVIRSGASPHHVPRVIAQVGDIPRTRSGKLSELAVRDVVEGRPVGNIGALANPEALEEFKQA